MRPEFRPGRPRGLRSVAKRVPTVQGRAAMGRLAMASARPHEKAGTQSRAGFRLCAAMNGPVCAGDEPHRAQRGAPQRTLACARKFHSLVWEFPQTESRRVGTRRLPYVGDRVGGLGVRPPALGSLCGDYRRSPPECSISIMPLSLRRGPHSRCIMPSRPRKPPRSAPPKRLSIAKRRF